MNNSAQINWLEDTGRLHLQHGPIDLIIEANGSQNAVQEAYQRACNSFPQILPDLVKELDILRSPLDEESIQPNGIIAKRMHIAAKRHAHDHFITPMIAVAGSVADRVLQVMCKGEELLRAYVNNGGDIALYLNDSQYFDIGICNNIATGNINSTVQINTDHGIGGIATSGWRGRSHSLGVADAVTVLAVDAASADAAATLIANAVDVPESNKVTRIAAKELSPDSDLNTIPVTVAVDTLNALEVEQALAKGELIAQQMLCENLINAAYISLQGKTVVCGGVVDHEMLLPTYHRQFEPIIAGTRYA